MRSASVVLAIALAACSAGAQISNIVMTSPITFQVGMPAPGSVATIFCSGLQGIKGIISVNEYPLPLELSGVRVTMAGVSAPLFAVADLGGYQQINIQVPWRITSAAEIVVEQAGQRGSAGATPVLYPGDFFRMPDGSGAFQHTDYTLVSSGNPAHAGEVVVGYLTGLWAADTVPAVATGQPAPSAPPAVVPNEPLKTGGPLQFQVSLGDPPNQKVIDPLFLGLTPGLVGVYQVNFRVPEGSVAGNQPVRIIENHCVKMLGVCVAVSYPWQSTPALMAIQ